MSWWRNLSLKTKIITIFFVVAVFGAVLIGYSAYQGSRSRGLGIKMSGPEKVLIGVPFEFEIDVANVSGGQVQNIRGSSRENWPIGEKRDPEFTLKKLALGGFKTNLGDRYQRRLKALDRLKKKREEAKKRSKQESNDGIPF